MKEVTLIKAERIQARESFFGSMWRKIKEAYAHSTDTGDIGDKNAPGKALPLYEPHGLRSGYWLR